MFAHPKKKFRRFSLFSATLLVFLSFLYCVPLLGAAASPDIPQPSGEFFYYDEANVLSEATRQEILAKNAELSQQEVQIVVMTVNTLPVSGYAQRVEYLRSVMQAWSVGGEQSRGLLLALSIADQDYIAVAGDGLHSCFTTESLKSLLDAQLEPDFDAQNYDAGVAKFFAEAASHAQAYAGEAPAGSSAAAKEQAGISTLGWVAIIAGGVALLSLAVFLLAGRAGRRRYSSRRTVHRHTPLVTPSRTNVLRHENNAPVVVKSSRSSGGIYHRGGTRGRKG